MSAPDLVTERLLLRKIDAAAARAVLAGGAPEGLTLAPGHPSPHSLDLATLAARGTTEADVGPYFVVHAADRSVIGEIACRIGATSRGPLAHVAYTIVEPRWNRGYATEALRSVLTHVLGDLGLPRVVGETLVGHGASRRVMAKAGMRPLGRRAHAAARPDQLITYEAVAGIWSLVTSTLATSGRTTTSTG